MRRLLLAAVAVASFAVPAGTANASFLVNGCGSGDWTVAQVVVAGREIAQVCTDRPPVVITCGSICDKIHIY